MLVSDYMNMMKPYHETEYVRRWTWMGIPILQLPTDMFMIQELVHKVKPTFIIETGIAKGGSAAFYSDLLYSIPACRCSRVLAIDIKVSSVAKYNLYRYRSLRGLSDDDEGRVSLFESDSTSPKLLRRLTKIVSSPVMFYPNKVLIVLDSNHTHDHVLKELIMYSPLVSVGSYLIVMDTSVEWLDKKYIGDRPWGKGNSPWSAVQEFMKDNDEFIVDKEVEEKVMITSAPGGWLRRVK